MIPLLMGKRVSLNDGRFLGTVSRWSGLYLTLTDVTHHIYTTPTTVQEFRLHGQWIYKIEIINEI